MRRLIWFLLPLFSYGQCDIEILGFDPISTDLLITVNGGQCGTPADSIGEFILALGFNPPLESNFPCFNDEEWMLLLYPLDFPGFEIGQGPDNILQTGDTLLFNILEDTPLAGSGTLECWEEALRAGTFFDDECVVLTFFQINDSECIDGSCEGLAGIPYPDENLANSWLEFSLGGACDPPPPPVDPEPTDTTTTPPPPIPVNPDCEDPCIHVPNTFTPNNDGTNDRWRPITRSECWMEWELQVYNRWGEVVWWSVDPEDWWLGGDKSYVSDGVYTWKVTGTTFRSTKVVSMVGHVTIFR